MLLQNQSSVFSNGTSCAVIMNIKTWIDLLSQDMIQTEIC